MTDKPKGVGKAIRGFGNAMLKLINVRSNVKGPGLSDYYYKGTKKRPTVLSKYYKKDK